MGQITGLIFTDEDKCNDLNNDIWDAIKPPFAPKGTKKPDIIPYPSGGKWVILIKKHGYYYENKIKNIITEEQKDSITILGEDWTNPT